MADEPDAVLTAMLCRYCGAALAPQPVARWSTRIELAEFRCPRCQSTYGARIIRPA